MYDLNVFAVRIPIDTGDWSRTAFRLQENTSRFHKATGGVTEKPTIDSREPNRALSSPSQEGEDRSATDRILLTFDNPPKNSLNRGQFGTKKVTSDVLLGHRGKGGVSSL